MGAFRKLTWRRLPRVMVRILALDEETRREVAGEVADALNVTSMKGQAVDDLAVTFAEILDLPQHERARFCGQLNQRLDILCEEDVFGSEAQLDPRGDHKE